jgi:hypothetical protein
MPLCARSAGSVAHRTSPAAGNDDGILLASLYDAKGDRVAAIKLLEATYAGVRKYTDLELLRDDPRVFANLKNGLTVLISYCAQLHLVSLLSDSV